MCQSGNESVDLNIIDTTASFAIEGDYQCVSCNNIGTVAVNFRVEIIGIES